MSRELRAASQKDSGLEADIGRDMLQAEWIQEHRRLEALVEQLDPDGAPQLAWVHRASKGITQQGGRLGVFSGSFNPLTVAHVEMIDVARAAYQLDEALLILGKANVDKGVFGLSHAQRLFSLKGYAVENEHLSVAACSHGRFIEKVEALRPQYPSDTHVFFIVGYDTFVRIFDPKYYTDFHGELETLFRQCRLIVANRNTHGTDAIRQFLADSKLQRYEPYIDRIKLSEAFARVSSTEIRYRMQNGLPVSHLIPYQIEIYLYTTNTYQTPIEGATHS